MKNMTEKELLFFASRRHTTHTRSLEWKIFVIQLLKGDYYKIRRRQWHPTLVLLPGKSYGQRRLAGYSPRGCKESYRTEVT